MRHPIIVFYLMSVFCVSLSAQDDFIDRSFLIIQSTTDFKEAERFARQASASLDLPYEAKPDCSPHSELGFECKWDCDCGLTHEGYNVRGRSPGNFVSVEHSTSYKGFSKGYYLVIVADGGLEEVKSQLAQIQEVYLDAYVKTAEVYVGCMH